MFAFAKVPDAVAREDRGEAEGEGTSNTLKSRSAGEFFEGHNVSETGMAFLRACVGWVDRVSVGSGGVGLVGCGVGGVSSGGCSGSGLVVGRGIVGAGGRVSAGYEVVAVALGGVAEALVLDGEVSVRNV